MLCECIMLPYCFVIALRAWVGAVNQIPFVGLFARKQGKHFVQFFSYAIGAGDREPLFKTDISFKKLRLIFRFGNYIYRYIIL